MDDREQIEAEIEYLERTREGLEDEISRLQGDLSVVEDQLSELNGRLHDADVKAYWREKRSQ